MTRFEWFAYQRRQRFDSVLPAGPNSYYVSLFGGAAVLQIDVVDAP